MRRIVLSLAIGAVVALPIAAQPVAAGTGTEFRSFVGALIPTGAHRDDFKAATLLGAQLAQELSSNVHVLASLGWASGTNKFTPITDHRTYIWQYDAGVELNAIMDLPNRWLWRPLIGAGVGGRTYDYRAANVGSKTCTAGYVNAGTEFQRSVVALRVDLRDYVNCFESPMSGKRHTRNDVGLSFGLVYHIR